MTVPTSSVDVVSGLPGQRTDGEGANAVKRGRRGAAPATGPTWLTAGVDLLPDHYRTARAVGSAQRGIALGLGVIVLALAAATVQAHLSTSAAEGELAEVTARQASLTAQASQMSEVPRVLGELSSLESARTAAFAGEVRWYSYLEGFGRSVPEGVWLTNLSWGTVTEADAASGASAAAPTTQSGSATGATATDGSAATSSTSGAASSSTGGAGLLTLEGSTQDPALVAAWLESAAATEGFAQPTYTDLARIDVGDVPVYHFKATVVVTDAALSHRFDTAGSADASTGAGS